jgi:hypothetical protein
MATDSVSRGTQHTSALRGAVQAWADALDRVQRRVATTTTPDQAVDECDLAHRHRVYQRDTDRAQALERTDDLDHGIGD